jgi:hypothetical protein
MGRWEAFYRSRILLLIQDFNLFKEIVTKDGSVAWKDEFASCLRLGINLITQELLDVVEDKDPKFMEWTLPLPSLQVEADEDSDFVGPATSIGGPLARPHVEGQKPRGHTGKPMQEFVSQIVLSDFASSVTTFGILPDHGTLSLYYNAPNCVIYEPDLDISTDCDLVFPSKHTGAPELSLLGYVESLVIDSYAPAAQEISDMDSVSSSYDKRRRIGAIPIEKFHLIGGQPVDFQGNHMCDSTEFSLLQTDIDEGYMIQMFFVVKLADIQKLDFSKALCGDSLSR